MIIIYIGMKEPSKTSKRGRMGKGEKWAALV